MKSIFRLFPALLFLSLNSLYAAPIDDLRNAVKRGRVEETRRLLRNGADPNYSYRGSTILRDLLLYNPYMENDHRRNRRRAELVIALLEGGATPYFGMGGSALQIAFAQRNRNIVPLFTQYEQNVFVANTEQLLIVFAFAAVRNDLANIAHLLSMISLVEAQYFGQLTDLHRRAFEAGLMAAVLARQCEMVRYLRDLGAETANATAWLRARLAESDDINRDNYQRLLAILDPQPPTTIAGGADFEYVYPDEEETRNSTTRAAAGAIWQGGQGLGLPRSAI